MKPMKTSALLATTLLSALLLTGCNSGGHTTAPAPSSTSAADSDDTTGTYRPMIGMNGKIGVGLDLGGGLSLSPSGNLGVGY
jgi:hypothetical protein